MTVTSVKINYCQQREDDTANRLKGFAKILIDGELAINTIKIIETAEKRFLVFPERTLPMTMTEGEKVTIPLVNPITANLRNHITDMVFAEYDKDPRNPNNLK